MVRQIYLERLTGCSLFNNFLKCVTQASFILLESSSFILHVSICFWTFSSHFVSDAAYLIESHPSSSFFSLLSFQLRLRHFSARTIFFIALSSRVYSSLMAWLALHERQLTSAFLLSAVFLIRSQDLSEIHCSLNDNSGQVFYWQHYFRLVWLSSKLSLALNRSAD